MVRRLCTAGYEVQIVATKNGFRFLNSDMIKFIQGKNINIWTDDSQWPDQKYTKNQEILHISLGDWADLLLVAPLTADTLGKIARGACDNLLMSLVRAWHRDRPIILAPAMNTRMWEHPATEIDLQQVKNWYDHVYVVGPIKKQFFYPLFFINF